MDLKVVCMEANEILSQFLSIRESLGKLPKRKSNYKFVGHLFLTLLFKELRRHIPRKYELVKGPLWIDGIEWVEWDGAVMKSMLLNDRPALYEPQHIIALFETKARGVYGGEKECERILKNIKDNFQYAKKRCPNLKQCIYVTLQEQMPKKDSSINYYGLTKKILEPQCLVIALFQSPVENKPVSEATPYPGEWQQLLEVLEEL